MILEGFSIREYAANMRSINFDKCWPFDCHDGARAKSLPEISVRKFRFWSDELKSDEISIKTPSKGKQKTPKKRSIVEIFAVAPQIEAAEDDDDDDVDEIKETRIKKKKVKKEKIGKKKKLKVQICATKKEKTKKPTSSAHIFQTLQHKQLSKKKSKSPIGRGKSPMYTKTVPKNRKLKLLQSSKVISKKQKEPGKVLQKILKNTTKGPKKKTRVKSKLQVGNTNNCSHIDIPQLRSLCKIFSDVLAASSALDNTLKGDNLPSASDVTLAENAGDANVARNIIEARVETSSEKEKSSESHIDLMPPICIDRACIDVNQTSTLVTIDRDLNDHRVGLSSLSDIQAKETSLKTSDTQSLTTTIERCIPRSKATESPSFTRNLSPPHCISYSMMSLEENGGQYQPPLDPLSDCYWQIKELPLMHNLPSKDLMQSYKDKCIGENFVGLPLNSQGELIHLQSGANYGSIHSYPTPNYAEPLTSVDHVKMMKGKFPGVASNQRNQTSLFQEQCFHVSNPAVTGNGYTNLRGSERVGVQSNETLRDDNRTQNYIDRVNFQPEQHSIQQTMRLMGTNVTIGRSNKGCQSYDDTRIWTDKETINDQYRISDRSFPQHQQWVAHRPFGSTLKSNLFHPLDASSNFYHMQPYAPKLGFTHFDYRPQSIISSVKMGHQIPMGASTPPLSYEHMLLNSTHCKHSQGTAYSTTSSLHPPFLYQETQNLRPPYLYQDAQNFRPCFLYQETRQPRLPFLYNETRSLIQPSPNHDSSSNLPQWLINAKVQRSSQEPSCSCYINDPVASQPQQVMVQSSRTEMGISNRKKMNREGTTFNFTYLKPMDTAAKMRKRPAAKDDVFMKPAKKPFLKMQEDTSVTQTDAANNLEIVKEKEGLRTLSLSSSVNVDGGSKSGPIKLSAGAKHILKPSQDKDQDSSRTIHSTIPFSIGNAYGKVLDPHMKAMEIFRF